MTLSWGAKALPDPVLRRLELADAQAAFELSQLIGWSHSSADWERILGWGGAGCFCLTQNDQLVATVTTAVYGTDRAWIGMVLTHPDHRRRGYARRLTQTAIDYLREQGVQRIMLDAAEAARPLYEDLGFRRLYSVEVWQGRASGLSRLAGSSAAQRRPPGRGCAGRGSVRCGTPVADPPAG